MSRRTVLIFVLIGVAAVMSGALLARLVNSGPDIELDSGTLLPQPRSVADFRLADLAGRPFDTTRLQGHSTLLFFGYTNCPDVCPTTLATLAQVQHAAPLPGSQVVFVTIDPERDSAANMQVYLGAFDHDFIGARGDSAAMAPLLRSLGAIAVKQALPDGSYTVDHSATVYLLDTQGRLRAVFSPPFEASKLDADLRRIAAAHLL